MSDTSQNNKRIAKNTAFLYVRMLFIMAVTLYTSRVVLNTLGVEDYGIYNVVGGVVAMFTVLSCSLANAISRYITFELGKGNKDKLKTVFSTSVSIQVLMALGIVALAEIVGVWFLNHKMNIPTERMNAANWVLHCSILAFAVNLISVPYNASIIAHEKMSAFAYISILEVTLKLAVVFLLVLAPYDKLIFYALLILATSILIRIIYGVYCKRNFEECRYRFILDRGLFKEMAGFAGWNFFGNTAYMLNTQGVNMLINLYFGVGLNAARAIAVQVEQAVTQFANNFMTALNPQITKSYASGDTEYMTKLVCRGSRFSYYIMLLFIVPIVLEADTLLSVWLKNVPEQTGIFLRLVLIATMSNIIGNPLYTAIISTGKIKRYQLQVTAYGCLVFPLTWLVYWIGMPAYSTYIIFAFIYFTLNAIRLINLKRLMNFPVMLYIKDVYSRILLVSAAAFILPTIIYLMMEESMMRFIVVVIVGVAWTGISCFLLGLDKQEKRFFTERVRVICKNKKIR